MSQILPVAKPAIALGGSVFPVGAQLASKERFQDFLKSYVHEKTQPPDAKAVSSKNTPPSPGEKSTQTARVPEGGQGPRVSTENCGGARSLKSSSPATKVSEQPVQSSSLPEKFEKTSSATKVVQRPSEVSAQKISMGPSTEEVTETFLPALQNDNVSAPGKTDEPGSGERVELPTQCVSDLEDDSTQSSVSEPSLSVASFNCETKPATDQLEVSEDLQVSETESAGVVSLALVEHINVAPAPIAEVPRLFLELSTSKLQNSDSEHNSLLTPTQDEAHQSALSAPVITHQATGQHLNTQIEMSLEREGKIRMSVEEDKDGGRHIHILAETSDALRSLSTNKESLLSSLNQSILPVSADRTAISTEVTFGFLGSFSQDYPRSSDREGSQQRSPAVGGSSEVSSEDLNERASVFPRKILRGVVDLTA